MTSQECAQLIGLTETNGKVTELADGGRAFSRFQVHPDWFSDHVRIYNLYAQLGETWDHWVERVVTEFAARFLPVMMPVEVAMLFHEGHKVEAGQADWDDEYAARFNSYAEKLGIAAT
jgi:hypothetical protein